jgi:hypothetical protein
LEYLGVDGRIIKMYRTIILPVVFYGCETWSLTLREKCMLRVFENRVLRRDCVTTTSFLSRVWNSKDLTQSIKMMVMGIKVIEFLVNLRTSSQMKTKW